MDEIGARNNINYTNSKDTITTITNIDNLCGHHSTKSTKISNIFNILLDAGKSGKKPCDMKQMVGCVGLSVFDGVLIARKYMSRNLPYDYDGS
jgi:hypothetical protein